MIFCLSSVLRERLLNESPEKGSLFKPPVFLIIRGYCLSPPHCHPTAAPPPSYCPTAAPLVRRITWSITFLVYWRGHITAGLEPSFKVLEITFLWSQGQNYSSAALTQRWLLQALCKNPRKVTTQHRPLVWVHQSQPPRTPPRVVNSSSALRGPSCSELVSSGLQCTQSSKGENKTPQLCWISLVSTQQLSCVVAHFYSKLRRKFRHLLF